MKPKSSLEKSIDELRKSENFQELTNSVYKFCLEFFLWFPLLYYIVLEIYAHHQDVGNFLIKIYCALVIVNLVLLTLSRAIRYLLYQKKNIDYYWSKSVFYLLSILICLSIFQLFLAVLPTDGFKSILDQGIKNNLEGVTTIFNIVPAMFIVCTFFPLVIYYILLFGLLDDVHKN